MTIEAITDRLRNWGRSQRGKLRQGQSGSAEGNFRPDPNAAWADAPSPSNYPIDMADAEVLEHCVCALSMFHHALLRYSFVDQLRDVGVCRYTERVSGKHLHPYRDLPKAMDEAVGALIRQLELPAITRKERARQRIIRIRDELGLDKQDDAA